MSVIGSFSSAVAGIQKGMADAQRSASKIASADTFAAEDPSSFVGAFVELKQAELQVKASAEVVKATDKMLGSLFDDFA